MNKTVNFIKMGYNKIISPIQNLHLRIKLTTVIDGKLHFNHEMLPPETSLYFTFFDWLLGIVQYGLILTLILYWYNTQSLWICPVALGLLYWIIPDFVFKIKEKLRSEN